MHTCSIFLDNDDVITQVTKDGVHIWPDDGGDKEGNSPHIFLSNAALDFINQCREWEARA